MYRSKNKTYHSKLILAGEYLVLEGYQALAMPFKNYYGQWKFKNEMDQRLVDYAAFLQDYTNLINLNQFKTDIQKGIYFDSNIPNGYGCGSSGALVAAIFDQYAYRSDTANDTIERLKDLESYFHGESSGIDPLVSFNNQPILIQNQKVSQVQIDEKPLNNFYIIDSKIPRITHSLVKTFKEKLKNRTYSQKVKELGSVNDKLVNAILKCDLQTIPKCMAVISKYQLELFDFAIPIGVRKKWEESYENRIYYKLCGAGGGGFFIVYSTEKEDLFQPIIVKPEI